MKVFKSVPIVRSLNRAASAAAEVLPAPKAPQKNVPAPYSKNRHSKERTGVLSFEALKKLETELNNRQVVARPEGCLPLWFLAETERNVALWRRGMSLVDSDSFAFAICVPDLIEKRLEQLKRCEPDNIFLYSMFGTAHTSQQAVVAEEAYLEALSRSLKDVTVHVQALEEAIREGIGTQAYDEAAELPQIVVPE